MSQPTTQKIIIDPVTRIEGHLRIEVELDEHNIVNQAWASGQLFRGIETILKGRDPRDTGLIAQRICGVCTNVHYRASISAVEQAYQIEIPRNAEIVRNLVTLALFVQDHLVHYYHLHSLDYVDVVSALSADPKAASEQAHQWHSHPYQCSQSDLAASQQKLTQFVQAGRLGLFANGYWGHSAYKFSPEQNLIHMHHYLEALRIQREISKAIAIFAGKTPHPQNLVVGGVTSVMDMLNPQRMNDYLFIIKDAREFIKRAYMPDMKMLVSAYRDSIKAGEGRGHGHFMSSGGYRLFNNEPLFAQGVVFDHQFDQVADFDPVNITEEAARSWYADNEPRSPYAQTTEPEYTDLNDDGSLKTEGKYSWIKSPRYQGKAMEVGPAARMIIGYLRDAPLIKPYVDDFMQTCDLELIDFSSSIGRNAARAIEAELTCDAIFAFASELIENIKYYDETTWTQYVFEDLPTSAQGAGIFEVPRGTLAHFVRIDEAKVANYQAVVPTTWNASPKDGQNQPGPYEASLIGIHLADPQNPLEVLRVVHSFDPCLACAVHVIDAQGSELAAYRIQPKAI
ncbi:nickel-dependent hydrogenase large subunit [Thiomicrospira microaerophila]|uniref:nickel-dependent hydrogenase large subunit n=1 Tax=Thiomicrospira microaerophila TaxID=406020 RepID=UPI0005CB48B1|nr:nickel-dependent hydrogenase large subunit [Thiomicrospira microaerophila]